MLKNKTNSCKFDSIEEVSKIVSKGDIVLTLGAGDVWKQGEKLLTLI